MRPFSLLSPPVVVTPPPSPEMLRIRVVLASRVPPPQVRSVLAVPSVVRRFVRKVASLATRAWRTLRPERLPAARVIPAPLAARPPPPPASSLLASGDSRPGRSQTPTLPRTGR